MRVLISPPEKVRVGRIFRRPTFLIVGLLALTILTTPLARAEHNNNSLLNQMEMVSYGFCQKNGENPITVYCEQYVAKDGGIYFAFYWENQVAVIKHVLENGKWEDVYVRP